jgi:hypothetical protein
MHNNGTRIDEMRTMTSTRRVAAKLRDGIGVAGSLLLLAGKVARSARRSLP